MHHSETPMIASAMLGTAAYQKASGKKPAARPAPLRRSAPKAARQPDQSRREIKADLLRNLHAQSNAGLVSIRDVSAALDTLLKTQRL